MSHSEPVRPGLRERKRQATHRRIAEEAARLVTVHGINATTVEQIAEASDVARATFFRYYDSKETAVAEGFSLPWVDLLVSRLRQQPADVPPVDALIATFAEMGLLFDGDARELALQQLGIAESSPTLQAWLLAAYVKFELLVSEAVAHRFPDLADDDPRPRLIGAVTMAAVRIGLEEWHESDGELDLTMLFQRALAFVEIDMGSVVPAPAGEETS